MSRYLLYSLFFVSLFRVQAASVFTFDSDSVGTSTAFTDTNNGISATFTSNGDPGGLGVVPSFFSSLTGNVLLDPGPANLNGLALTVSFSQAVSGLSLDFAINGGPSATFTLMAYDGNNLVGTVTASGSIPSGFVFPEGIDSFTGASFNKVVLSSTALDLAVDNILVQSAPEPATLSAVGCAALLGGLISYRRKSRTLLG